MSLYMGVSVWEIMTCLLCVDAGVCAMKFSKVKGRGVFCLTNFSVVSYVHIFAAFADLGPELS